MSDIKDKILHGIGVIGFLIGLIVMVIGGVILLLIMLPLILGGLIVYGSTRLYKEDDVLERCLEGDEVDTTLIKCNVDD